MTLKERIINALKRFESLEYQSLLDEVLCHPGLYSEANEWKMQESIRELREEGAISYTYLFGIYRLANRKLAASLPRV